MDKKDITLLRITTEIYLKMFGSVCYCVEYPFFFLPQCFFFSYRMPLCYMLNFLFVLKKVKMQVKNNDSGAIRMKESKFNDT